jgi:hypothetical protein
MKFKVVYKGQLDHFMEKVVASKLEEIPGVKFYASGMDMKTLEREVVFEREDNE